jgi:general secretion pathway protein C
MKNFSNSKIFSTFLYLLTIVVIAKLIWFVVSLLFLPTEGKEHIEITRVKNLYYRTKLANKQKEIVKPKKVVKKAPTINTMRGIKLLALYNSKEVLVVTVEKNRKTKVLSRGEDIDGFKLTSAGSDYAIFTKGGKEFKLLLDKEKIKTDSYIKPVVEPKKTKTKDKKKEKSGIVESEDGEKIVSRGLLSSYTKDIDKVWKDIGIGEHRTNGVLDGFKVNFVKRGSDFEKLGLKRGDILKAVNGQELNSYNAAFSFYKEIDSIENLTLSIIRNNQEMELEYEIK